MFSCQDYTKSVCLDIQNKMNVLDILNLLIRTLNINDDDNEAKVCGILTKFIIKLTDVFFIVIGEKASSNPSLNKTYYLRKMAKLTYPYVPMYLLLYDYPPYSD